MGIFDVLFPKRCMGCGKYEGAYICSKCVNNVKRIDEPICPMCGKGSVGGMVHVRCKKPMGMEGLVAGLMYKGVVKKMLWHIKYKGVEEMVGELVELWESMVEVPDIWMRECVIVPVPLSVKRRRQRGFNQAELFGQKMGEVYGVRVLPNALVRIRDVKPQMELSRKERLKNVQGIFGKGQDVVEVKDKNVLLVDDIWTTGATMRECTKVLKRNGAIQVVGLVMAR